MSTSKNITHKQGFAPNEHFVLKDSSGTAIDLVTNNWTAHINVRRGYKNTAPLLETFSTANTKLELDGSITGRINFNFDGTEFSTETIKGVESSFTWDMQATDGVSGVVHDLYSGSWTIRSNI